MIQLHGVTKTVPSGDGTLTILHPLDLTIGRGTVTAITGRAPAERAFVVQNGRIEERIVSTGARRDGRAPVKKGLRAGEVVVDNPGDAVRDGARVK